MSLELVNIWEAYLNKFSNPDSSLEYITETIEKLNRLMLPKGSSFEKAEFISSFYEENL